ncbi:saccharopine dehydrogenase, partial [Streptomyces caeni]
RRLRTVFDVTADVGSPLNLLPVYDTATDWEHPVRRLRESPVLDLIAIDNLPSLLPLEASRDFSASLTPLLPDLEAGGAWERCRERFDAAVRELRAGEGDQGRT